MAVTQLDKGNSFRALHQGPRAFIIANAWDAGSARILAGVGFAALATSSGAAAGTYGTRDGAITPYAAVQAQNFHTPTYSETDYSGGAFGLTYDARNATDTRSELGARYDKLVLLNWRTVLAWRAKLAWAHDWVTDPSLVPGFEALPGASFIVTGATPAKNSALTSAGAELRLINGVSVLAKFDGEFATHSQTYAGTGTVRYVW